MIYITKGGTTSVFTPRYTKTCLLASTCSVLTKPSLKTTTKRIMSQFQGQQDWILTFDFHHYASHPGPGAQALSESPLLGPLSSGCMWFQSQRDGLNLSVFFNFSFPKAKLPSVGPKADLIKIFCVDNDNLLYVKGTFAWMTQIC